MGCEEVQKAVFTKTRASRGDDDAENSIVVKDSNESNSGGEHEDEEDVEAEDDDGGVRLPPNMVPSKASTSIFTNKPNPSAKPPSPPLTLQQYGLKIAKQREQVRQAARRGVAFGLRITNSESDGGSGKAAGRRKAEAVQHGRVVEASFAKGEWGVRWQG